METLIIVFCGLAISSGTPQYWQNLWKDWQSFGQSKAANTNFGYLPAGGVSTGRSSNEPLWQSKAANTIYGYSPTKGVSTGKSSNEPFWQSKATNTNYGYLPTRGASTGKSNIE